MISVPPSLFQQRGTVAFFRSTTLVSRCLSRATPSPSSHVYCHADRVSDKDLNGLLSQNIRRNDETTKRNHTDVKHPSQQVLTEPQAASLTSSIQNLRASIDNLPAVSFEEPVKHIEEQVMILKNQCDLLTRAIEDLSKACDLKNGMAAQHIRAFPVGQFVVGSRECIFFSFAIH